MHRTFADFFAYAQTCAKPIGLMSPGHGYRFMTLPIATRY